MAQVAHRCDSSNNVNGEIDGGRGLIRSEARRPATSRAEAWFDTPLTAKGAVALNLQEVTREITIDQKSWFHGSFA